MLGLRDLNVDFVVAVTSLDINLQRGVMFGEYHFVTFSCEKYQCL